jgi:rhodanese-related sulfurtransferase
MNSISPKKLKTMMEENQKFSLLDVREPFELEIANIGGMFIPLSELPDRFDELEKETTIVVLCHHGIRSAQAQAYLLNQGFAHVLNLDGGIDAWSISVDPSLPRY